MSIFVMVSGVPYSGKSTYSNKLKSEGFKVHSSDDIREELFGNVVTTKEQNKEVFKTLHKRIKEDLSKGLDVCYDATNISYKRRMGFLQEIKKYNPYTKCVFMAIPRDVLLERRRHRDRIVPVDVIDKMLKTIYIPQYYEGWDEIEIVRYYNDNADIEKNLNKLNIEWDISQDNPHHTLTLRHHCLKAVNNLLEYGIINSEVLTAMLFHDCGKPFCKQFKNAKGEDTEIAHYYEHEHYGAYKFISELAFLDEDTINSTLKIANLIQWHMRLFVLENAPQKTTDRFIKLVGQDTFDELTAMHLADISAK